MHGRQNTAVTTLPVSLRWYSSSRRIECVTKTQQYFTNRDNALLCTVCPASSIPAIISSTQSTTRTRSQYCYCCSEQRECKATWWSCHQDLGDEAKLWLIRHLWYALYPRKYMFMFTSHTYNIIHIYTSTQTAVLFVLLVRRGRKKTRPIKQYSVVVIQKPWLCWSIYNELWHNLQVCSLYVGVYVTKSRVAALVSYVHVKNRAYRSLLVNRYILVQRRYLQRERKY